MVPSIEQINMAVDKSKHVIDSGKAVLVHCFAGKGRTGTCIASYLIKHENYTGQQAIQFLREKRPGSIETEGQEHFLIDYHNKLHPESKEDYPIYINPVMAKINKIRSHADDE